MNGAKLIYRYATMGSGKSTEVLQVHNNYKVRNVDGLLFIPAKDTSSDGTVSSRLGISSKAIKLYKEDNIFEIVKEKISNGQEIAYLIIDEINFIENIEQINQLSDIVDYLNIDVLAYGLLQDFKSELFPSSKRLIEVADRIEEISVKSICHCGKKAIYSARIVNNQLVKNGEIYVVDNKDKSNKNVKYIPLCRKHYKEGEWHK